MQSILGVPELLCSGQSRIGAGVRTWDVRRVSASLASTNPLYRTYVWSLVEGPVRFRRNCNNCFCFRMSATGRLRHFTSIERLTYENQSVRQRTTGALSLGFLVKQILATSRLTGSNSVRQLPHDHPDAGQRFYGEAPILPANAQPSIKPRIPGFLGYCISNETACPDRYKLAGLTGS